MDMVSKQNHASMRDLSSQAKGQVCDPKNGIGM